MFEVFAWLIIASSAVLATAVLLNMLNLPRTKSLTVACYPTVAGVPEPQVEGGHIVFRCPYDVILAQSAHEDGGWSQEVLLQQRVRIPSGYAGLLSVAPFAFRYTNGRTHNEVVAEPEFLPAGWEGDIRIFLMNRHATEPAICEKGSPVATLLLVPTDSNLSLRVSVNG